MTFPVVQATNNASSTTAGSSHTLALPAGIASDNLVLIQMRCISASMPTPPAGWEQLFQTTSGTVQHIGLWKIADGSETSVTITLNTSVAAVRSVSHRITGHGGVIEAATNTQVSASNHDPPALSPSWGARDTLWIVGDAFGSSGAFSAVPSGYGSTIFAPTPSGSGLIFACHRTANAATENPGTFTNSSTNGNTATIGIKPGLSFPFRPDPMLPLLVR